jgi:hypothetical protein
MFFNAVHGNGRWCGDAIRVGGIDRAVSPDPEQNSSLNDPDIVELKPHRAAVIKELVRGAAWRRLRPRTGDNR